MRDEEYVLNLCDEVLGCRSSRQHRFAFLCGDTGRPLPVDAYYPELSLVIEYQERQHVESAPFFDRRKTVSGVSRGIQRALYDQRRREVLPQNALHLVEFSVTEFAHNGRKRLLRLRARDVSVICARLAPFISGPKRTINPDRLPAGGSPLANGRSSGSLGVMSKPVDIEALRTEALRKVGRNVVNFQKIEACLKYLLAVSNIEGTSTIIASRRRVKEKDLRRRSLGDLAQAFHTNLFSDEAPSAAPPDLPEIWASISIKVIADAGAVTQRKRALSALVAERNKLIHQELVRFDHNSAQSCHDLINVLDAQNVRILEQLRELKLLIDTVKEHVAEIQSWVTSDDLLQHLQSDPHDA